MTSLPILAAGLIGSTISLAVVISHKTSSLRNLEWNDLLSRLSPVSAEAVGRVAIDHLQPHKGQIVMEPYEMWDLVGGLEGLGRMRENARIFCALAAYAERWNYDEAVIVTERIRRESVTVRRAVLHIRVSRYQSLFAKARAPFHLQEAASAYYLMRMRLLALYESSHAGLYVRLSTAL